MIAVLYEPEIPPNTGNIARLCAAFDIELHLVEPLGFKLENRYLKRAGLDYWPNVSMRIWKSWPEFIDFAGSGCRIVPVSTKALTQLPDFHFVSTDALIFGPETRGLPASILAAYQNQVRIPVRGMDAGGVRSLNLATACGIVVYTALAYCGMLDF